MDTGFEGTKPGQTDKASIGTWPIEREMRGLVASGQHLNQDTVYETLSSKLPLEEVIDKVRDDFGINTAEGIIEETRAKLGENYLPLLIEPSLSTRFDDFVIFAKNTLAQYPELTPWELRNRFKDSLGKKTVYRVSTASPSDLENILTNGFIANFYRTKSIQALLENEDGYQSIEYNMSGLRGRVNIHAGAFAQTKDSMFISVSDYPEMAQYAGTVQLIDKLPTLESDDRKLYLFPIELDEFYLVRNGKYLEQTIKGEGLWTDGKIEIPYGDPGVEALIEFRISADSLKRDEIQTINPSSIPQFKFVPKTT